jgi:hypothetical protein
MIDALFPDAIFPKNRRFYENTRQSNTMFSLDPIGESAIDPIRGVLNSKAMTISILHRSARNNVGVFRVFRVFRVFGVIVVLLALSLSFFEWRNALIAGELPSSVFELTAKYCASCHGVDSKEGNLDLASLPFDPDRRSNFETWVKVFDRVSEGEMPPKGESRHSSTELTQFRQDLSKSLISAEGERIANEGRSTQRRLNRFEYENTVRDLLHAPWLQLKELLPEDGEAHHFNKVGDALDMSHVQMARYLAAADYALRQVVAQHVQMPETKTVRFYAR